MKPNESNTTFSSAGLGGGGAGASPAGRALAELKPSVSPGGGDVEIRRIMTEVMSRRARGEVLSDDRVLAEHPDLRPQLTEELEGLRMIRRAFLAAQKAGPVTDDAIAPIEDLDQLEAPIDAPPADERTPWDDPQRPLHVHGYQILSEISRGGQATVFKAIQEVTGRRVAVKVLPGGPLAGSRHRARFEREAQALAALDHPNVVGILDRGRTVDGSFFLVMQFIDGCALDDYAAESQLADADFPVQLLRIFVKICDAVHEAHRLGIVHRDLKPSNIRVDSRGEPHLLDFGLARILGNDEAPGPDSMTVLTMAGQVVGSIPWTSPEQATGGSAQVDARSDVYSLGVCLYQCLTGRFPYPVAGSITDIVKHITATPASPLRWTSVRFARTAALESVLARALAKSPGRRYATAADLARDLEALLDGQPVSARDGFFSPARRWVRPVVWGAVACLTVGTWWSMRHWPTGRGAQPTVVLAQRSIRNSVGMKMVLIRGGRFLMGATLDEQPNIDERLHEVRITRDFWVADREVTWKQFREVMGDPENGLHGEDDLPITGITWHEAAQFCDELNKREPGRRYRLPSEAEWEYACRAGGDDPFVRAGGPNGVGWHRQSAGGSMLHEGGKLEPNEWGLYDFHGNVAEWCDDKYQEQYINRVENPSVGGEPEDVRVVRGGSYTSLPHDCRAAARDKEYPFRSRPDLGFRVVFEVNAAVSGLVR